MVWSVGNTSVKLGTNAGEVYQASEAVAIGYHAGQTAQGKDAIAIGRDAGNNSQGAHSIAIGSKAGETEQHPNSIVVSATTMALDSAGANSLFVKPIRQLSYPEALLQPMRYNNISGEVSYSTYVNGGGQDGARGVLPSDTAVDANGMLSATIRGEEADVGNIRGFAGPRGDNGDPGPAGRVVVAGDLSPSEDLTVTYSNNSTQLVGNVRGYPGPDAVIVTGTNTDANTGDVTVWFSDGRRVEVVPPESQKGPRGDGLSTTTGINSDNEFIVRLDNGVTHNAGTIVGVAGDRGDTGPAGPTGDPGVMIVGATGDVGLRGDPGVAGDVGEQGDVGDQGASVVGAKGPTGPTGPSGASSALPNGGCVSDYARYDGTSWVLGGDNVALGCDAGKTSQGVGAVAMGLQAGETSQGAGSLAIGHEAGRAGQGANAVAIGPLAGTTNQGIGGVAVGSNAGKTNQAFEAVAIGAFAGANDQGTGSVAIGYNAGLNACAEYAVGVGSGTLSSNSSPRAIALGFAAGQSNAGTGSISIGYKAGIMGNVAGSCLIRARDNGQNESVTNPGLYIQEPRNLVGSSPMYYNTTTGEITHGSSSATTKQDVAPMSEPDSRAVLERLLLLQPKRFKYLEKTIVREKVAETHGRPSQAEVEAIMHDPPSERTPRAEREVDTEFFGLIAEEVAEVCPSLVHFDHEGNALDIKWTDLQSLLMQLVCSQSARIAQLAQ